jgi:hypothetical protein
MAFDACRSLNACSGDVRDPQTHGEEPGPELIRLGGAFIDVDQRLDQRRPW